MHRLGSMLRSLTAASSLPHAQINVLDTLAPAVVRELTAGPIDFNGTVPSFVITVYRWFPGLPELSWGFNDAAGRLQIRAVDLQNFSAPPTRHHRRAT